MKAQLSDPNAEMIANITDKTNITEVEAVNLILDQFRKTPEERVSTILLHRHVLNQPKVTLDFSDTSFTEEQAKEMLVQIGDGHR